MSTAKRTITILLADDDADDRMLVQDALVESGFVGELRCVEDGEALLEYLRRLGPYAAEGQAPSPDLILLDLNMPKIDGRQALTEIRADPELRHIPVVILTTSKAAEDVERSYDLGANSFMIKPVTYDGLVKLMQGLAHYLLNLVEVSDKASSGE